MQNKQKIKFRHPANFREWPKVKKLYEEMGVEGYGILMALLEMVYEDQGNFCVPATECDYTTMTKELGVQPEQVKQVVRGYRIFSEYKDDDKLLIILW